MISFKKYFFQESVVTGLAGSQIGLNNTDDFPNSPPYGFWVDRSGNWIDVPSQGHLSVAQEILRDARKYKKDNNIPISKEELQEYKDKLHSFKWPYTALQVAGFMHVVLGGGTFFFNPAQITSSQRRFISKIKDKYNKEAKFDNELI